MDGLSFGLALSLHLLPGDFNAVHPFVEYEKGGFFASAYYNSMHDGSIAIGRRTYITEDWSLDKGLVTGYADGVTPMLRLKYKDYFIVPGRNNGETGIVLGIEKKF